MSTDKRKPTPAPTTPRIDALYSQPTKLLCFGRYAIRVPLEAQLDWGYQDIGNGFETYEDAAKGDAAAVKAAVKNLLQKHWNKVYAKDDTAEIIHVVDGPQPGGRVLWYHEDEYDKRDDTRRFYGIAVRNGHAFSFEDMALKGEVQLERTLYETLLRNLRYRADDEAPPREPGVCLNKGFVLEGEYQLQEMFSAGIYLPSLPDVRFSVVSNKTASVTNGNEITLLQSIQNQKKLLGWGYPQMVTLREGKRTLSQVWAGEESLTRRKDGTHEFDWEYTGKRTVSQPGQLEAKLYTKVAQDRIGAASASSLTDAEVLDLWDRLLGGLGFRVAVPGGPAGLAGGGGASVGGGASGDGDDAAQVQVSGLRPGDVCPVSGMWRVSHVDPKVIDPTQRQDNYVQQGAPLPGQTMAYLMRLPIEGFSVILVKALPQPGDKA